MMPGSPNRLSPVAPAVLLLLPLLPSCSDDAAPAPYTPECSDDAPCQGRVRICEHGRCVQSTRCETDVDCPETDADGSPLLCENGICLEFCQGYKWCPQPYYVCELETHMGVRRDVSGTCETHDDCDPEFTCGPHLQPDGT